MNHIARNHIRNGVSALGLQRELGLGSYETAWTWLHKLRRAMVRPGRDLLSGTVEVDETYVGGPEQGTRGREPEGKAIVAIAAEKSGRGLGRVRLQRVADVSTDIRPDHLHHDAPLHPAPRFPDQADRSTPRFWTVSGDVPATEQPGYGRWPAKRKDR